ncbi:MAG: peptide deformylase [Phycisphaerae bacterium]|nr:peptide deformylase [Phycisphaerae bacterium]
MLTAEEIDQLTLVKYPDPVLAETAKPIEKLDTWVEQLAQKMIQLMHEFRGVGLAGNQVGLALAIFTYNPSGEEGDDHALINPEIVDEEGWAEAEEGCLSLPEIYGKVRRRQRVILEATDLTGNRREIEATDLTARIFQHETDHLRGTLIVQRMSVVGKLAARRQLKMMEEKAAD